MYTSKSDKQIKQINDLNMILILIRDLNIDQGHQV